ncbi:uncharacterized protein PADG_12394 [Paracoccidioides brasiliensis Pb18]|uniref:Uncharacterized protein n=1 Tax=Paracoccidioides brasiliensis (strain Pb18) TaxID=502780 RepID=A0A0A0HU44_PARBD|nr:uncharacterized protein PADG_12394 [Paracoccidioides brasiliensis Pb18]KGM91536.1 hypothetical protein PADG_12394 [Paracoccidioides brasiliensis Pb18]
MVPTTPPAGSQLIPVTEPMVSVDTGHRTFMDARHYLIKQDDAHNPARQAERRLESQSRAAAIAGLGIAKHMDFFGMYKQNISWNFEPAKLASSEQVATTLFRTSSNFDVFDEDAIPATSQETFADASTASEETRPVTMQPQEKFLWILDTGPAAGWFRAS